MGAKVICNKYRSLRFFYYSCTNLIWLSMLTAVCTLYHSTEHSVAVWYIGTNITNIAYSLKIIKQMCAIYLPQTLNVKLFSDFFEIYIANMIYYCFVKKAETQTLFCTASSLLLLKFCEVENTEVNQFMTD